MPRYEEFEGAVFDLDDTLLDNGPGDKPELTLHARSRLAAVHAVADELSIAELSSLTPQENAQAFRTANQHTLESAIWNIMYMKGLAESNDADPSSPYLSVVHTIVERKNDLHRVILLEHGVEVPGASDFVRKLAAVGMSEHMALATQAVQWDIDFFLDKYELRSLFPPDRIVGHDKISEPKPDKQAFDLAFRSLKLPDNHRRSVLAFEDNARGLRSAQAAGLFVCAITTRLQRNDPVLQAIGPDFIADSFQEFGDWLELPELPIV